MQAMAPCYLANRGGPVARVTVRLKRSCSVGVPDAFMARVRWPSTAVVGIASAETRQRLPAAIANPDHQADWDAMNVRDFAVEEVAHEE
jgi:hypothetical protein